MRCMPETVRERDYLKKIVIFKRALQYDSNRWVLFKKINQWSNRHKA